MENEFYPLFYQFNFYLFGLIALVSAIVFVTRKSPVAAALWLVMVMFALAALYVMLGAEFVGMMQILVYAGAIMVVFLFVVMLLNPDTRPSSTTFAGSGDGSRQDWSASPWSPNCLRSVAAR